MNGNTVVWIDGWVEVWVLLGGWKHGCLDRWMDGSVGPPWWMETWLLG